MAGARAAFARHAWSEAFAGFAAADEEPLDAADHERMAISAYLIGADDACVSAWESAHRATLAAGDAAGAARGAFWLGLILMLRGQMAPAGGWLTRAQTLVETAQLDCPAAGYLLIPRLLEALESGDAAAARDLAVAATNVGRRFGDADLCAFGTLGHGQALIALDDTAGGTARLDEAMVSVTAGEVGPITTGIVYCAVILECMQLFDLQRATEWTEALRAWCDDQPDLVPYRGQCLVHRSQLMQASGDWTGAMTLAAAARERLDDPPHPALGLACYQAAELHRLTGAFDAAELEYRHASRNGREPMPGLALLELAHGDVAAAAATIRRALEEHGSTVERPALLAAAVDIARVGGDLANARAAVDELRVIAARSSSAVLRSMAAQASGTVLVCEGDAVAALTELRAAAAGWQSLHMPYEGARVATLIGLACSMLGDRISARIEFDNARETFVTLGAVPDVERLDLLQAGLVHDDHAPGGAPQSPILSARELEVLTLVCAGRTNREIAAELAISAHTVSRHVEHIFAKLDVTNRAAATAYAYANSLL